MKIEFRQLIFFILTACASITHAAETVCNNNGGAGWPITDFGTTNLSIPFVFGDVSTAVDVDIRTDITHTWVGDLRVDATSPNGGGTTAVLFDRPGTAAASGPPFGCNGNNILVTFDDESPNPPLENAPCGNNPAFSGTHQPHNPAPNDLSIFDTQDPTGNWDFVLTDNANGDTGTLNEICLIVAYAAVTFDKWVSTNNTCSDTLDILSVAPGTNVFYCYITSNPSGAETFTINPGDATDDQGHDISALETAYLQNTSQSVVIGPLLAGTDVAAGTTVNNAQIIATYAITPPGTLTTGEVASLTVADPIINTSTKTVVDLNGGSADPGDILEYTITINETAGIYTPNITVTDVVDANLTTVNVTSIPAGATDNTIGNNIDVSGIILPASGSVTVVFRATIGLLVPPGTNIPNSATITHAGSGVSFNAVAPIVIVSAPVLSTSSKTVLDVNGPPALAGDLLRYTITINESIGNPATNVQVIDVLDANLTALNIISIPPGAVDNTIGNTIDISNISIAANGSETIIFEANINGAAPVGTSINNSANITDIPTGVNATPSAPTVVVTNAATSGNKQLYLDTLNAVPNLTRVIPPANTTSPIINFGNTLTVNQAIIFQAPFTITGGSTINAQLWVRRRNGNGPRTVNVNIINGGTGLSIGNNSQTWNAGAWTYLTFPVVLAADANFATGDFVRLVLTNTSPNNRNVRFRTLNGGVNALIQMLSNTVVNVDAVGTYSTVYPGTTQFLSYAPGSTIFIRATVSDPFGNADITSANITITDSAPLIRVNNVPMTSVATPTGATRVFEYQYVLPGAPSGFWTASITANEGTEGVFHTTSAIIIVGNPGYLAIKSSQVISDPINITNPKAIPGAIIEYSIIVTNTDFGYADNNSIVLTDPLSSNLTLFLGSPANPAQFIDGVINSGLTYTFTGLSSGTDDIDFSNNGGISFITPSADGSGFDVTVPPVNFIRINPKGDFRGSDGVNQPSFSIRFRTRVN